MKSDFSGFISNQLDQRLNLAIPVAFATQEWSKMNLNIRIFSDMLEFGSGRIALGGHRGMGANAWTTDGPGAAPAGAHFRENTIMSFIAAANSGCTFIEFDIQVTADGHAVIFHDNYLVHGSESSPTSSLVKHLSLADFKSLAPINSSSDMGSLAGASDDDASSIACMPVGGSSPFGGSPLGGSPFGGSPSGGSPSGGSPRVGRLMRQHKNGVPATAFDPSLRPWEVVNEDDFPTLTEVFQSVPSNIGFDIEVKMTTPHDMEQTPADEVERVVDATLSTIEAVERTLADQGGSTRAIMFSSFDPDVCLRLKQLRPNNTIMFLSAGGVDPHVDRRRTSVQAAIDFAESAGLEGIILESSVLKEQHGMVGEALRRGLHVLTYGTHNDEPEWVREQERLGVHAVIVDDVRRIASAFSREMGDNTLIYS